jgi:hypothetical protein
MSPVDRRRYDSPVYLPIQERGNWATVETSKQLDTVSDLASGINPDVGERAGEAALVGVDCGRREEAGTV